jgi:hypothetical protein
VREAYSQKDPEIRREKLQQALSHYRKSDSFAAKVCFSLSLSLSLSLSSQC